MASSEEENTLKEEKEVKDDSSFKKVSRRNQNIRNINK